MEPIMVVGAGFMGAGIAQVCAQSGYSVRLTDLSQEILDRALAGIRSSAAKLHGKGILTDAPDEVMARIHPQTDLAGAPEAGWIIEAVVEELPLKLELFGELGRLSRPATPLASNTSSIPITRLAAAAQHPQRVLGLHFFGPVPLMGLVEVVRAEQTADQVLEHGVGLVRSLGKTPVRVERDLPGFVMNRVFAAAFREAADLVAAGVVSPEDLDAGMRMGYGWNAGPFEIADNAGLDTVARIGRFLKSAGEADLFPRSDLVERMVDQGRLGRKAGKGFYDYDSQGKRAPRKNK